MRRRMVKISLIVAAILLVVFVSYLCYRKIEQNRIQAETVLAEMQSKLNDQKGVMDTQQSKIDELQKVKDEQQQVNEEEANQNEQNNKADCEARLKKQQDSLASAQRSLGEYQMIVSYVKADNCPKEKTKLCDTVCYDDCLKQNDCTKSSCDDDVKKECKKRHEENLANITKEMNDEAENVKNIEVRLQSIKSECAKYLN